MNGQLNRYLVNPYLASTVSFAIITFFFIAVFFALPHALPTAADLKSLPWWAVLGGLVGAVQVFAGLTLVDRVGAGTFMAVTVSSALAASLVIEHFGLVSHGRARCHASACRRRAALDRRRCPGYQGVSTPSGGVSFGLRSPYRAVPVCNRAGRIEVSMLQRSVTLLPLRY